MSGFRVNRALSGARLLAAINKLARSQYRQEAAPCPFAVTLNIAPKPDKIRGRGS